MEIRTIARLASLLAVFAAIAPFGASYAALEKFDPYLYAKVLYDSNLFRSDNDEDDDTIGYLGGGVKADWKLSRQHLLLDAVVARAKYDSNDELDHTMIDATGAWAWQLGNLWNGQMGYRYEDRLTSFNQRLIRDKDMKKTQTGFLTAGYRIHPDWRLVAGSELKDVSYEERKRLDRDSYMGSLEVQYQNTLNTRVGVRGAFTQYDVKDTNVNGISVDNDYDISEISGVFYWEGTAKSALEARVGYTDVSYDELGDRDFQGVSYRGIFNWIYSEKTRVDVEAWREPSSLSDEILDYVLSQGVSISPTWQMTPKISFKGTVLYNNDDFKARNGLASDVGVQRRDDDTWMFRIAARWDPRNFLRLSLSYRREDRDSSIDQRDFDDDQVEGKVTFSF